MDETTLRIRKKVEEFLNVQVNSIERIENVPNNTVYKILADDKSYIFKIYAQRDWPEDGKLRFIHQKLTEHHIACAKLIVFDRSDPFFHNGFLLEECLPGATADRMVFDSKTGNEFYEKLALLVSNIHRIPIRNYGYIGSGISSHNIFMEFMNDKFDEIANALFNKKLFDKKRLLEIKKKVIHRLHQCENLPSVLNHGDLSTKNVVVDRNGELALIDWDDAMSCNWIADISRMTYWMKFHYSDEEYARYKNTFLTHYSTDGSKSDFYDLENAFHVWIGLDHLNYYANKPQYGPTLAYFDETLDKLK